MRQRLELPTVNQNVVSPPRVADNATNVLPAVATSYRLSLTGQRRRRLLARTCLSIGVFVLLVAFALFFNGIVSFLNVPSEVQESVNQTLGWDAMHDFNLHFFMLVLYLIVAAIYITYSIFLLRNPATKEQPAFLKTVQKRMAGQTKKQRALSAWMARGVTIFAFAMLVGVNYLRYRMPYASPLSLESILTQIGHLIGNTAMFGLNWIQAEVISPLIPSREDDDIDDITLG